jgi:hypothetical protein
MHPKIPRNAHPGQPSCLRALYPLPVCSGDQPWQGCSATRLYTLHIGVAHSCPSSCGAWVCDALLSPVHFHVALLYVQVALVKQRC